MTKKEKPDEYREVVICLKLKSHPLDVKFYPLQLHERPNTLCPSMENGEEPLDEERIFSIGIRLPNAETFKADIASVWEAQFDAGLEITKDKKDFRQIARIVGYSEPSTIPVEGENVIYTVFLELDNSLISPYSGGLQVA